MNKKLQDIFGDRVKYGEPLSRHTSIRVGGPTDVFAEVCSEDELRGVLDFCRKNGLPFLLVGAGTNLIVRDSGWRGVVARLSGPDFNRISFKDERVSVGGAALLKDLVSETIERSLSGLERLGGIYGTVGGATKMNAGAYGVTFGELVDSGRIMTYDGAVRAVRGSEMGFGYRSCALLEDAILLGVELKLERGNHAEIERTFKQCLEERESKLPDEPSAGSVFKNPKGGLTAGELIDSLGLRGARCGGAVVYERHGNIIVNRNGAKANDILSLVRLISGRVFEETGIELEPEVTIVGAE